MTHERERDAYGRRRLSDHERDELLQLPLAGVLSTLSPENRIHSVPVHFLWNNGELRMLAERDSVKCRNVRQSPRASLCVETTIGTNDRRYASAEGPVSVLGDVAIEDVIAFDGRYGRADARDSYREEYANSVTLVLHPARWIAWSDAD